MNRAIKSTFLAQLFRQSADGGRLAEPLAPLLSYRPHQRPIAARPAGMMPGRNVINRQEYVRRQFEAYRKTPGTTGRVHRQDRRFAEQLYELQVPLAVVENALLLAAPRRLLRPEDAPRLDVIRSLHYFKYVIDELLHSTMNEDYFLYLRRKLEAIHKQPPAQ